MKKQSDSTIQRIMYWGCWVILAALVVFVIMKIIGAK